VGVISNIRDSADKRWAHILTRRCL